MEGLWTVEFGSNVGTFASGVFVMREGKIEGGDASYFYVGSYETQDPENPYPSPFKARVEFRPYLPNRQSVFKTYDSFTLNLEGKLKDQNNATAVGRPE